MTANAFQRVLDALAAAGGAPHGGGRQFQAKCPAHEDGHASLSITRGNDRVLLKCHAGCDIDKIIGELKIKREDLFDEALPMGDDESWMPCGHGLAREYRYLDEGGGLLFVVARCTQKCFAQWRPDIRERSGRRWKLGDVRRVPYRLPELITAVAEKRTVYIVEGEKDVETLRGAGLAATSSPHGAGKWRAEFASYLHGASVVVVADRDQPGRAHAATVEASLRGVARDVTVVTPPPDYGDHADVTDVIGNGGTVADLVRVGDESVNVEPERETPVQRLRRQLVTAAQLDSLPEPEPLIAGVLYRNSLAWLYGAPGSTKSFLALDAAGCVGVGESWHSYQVPTVGPVLYLVAEGVSGIKARVRAWEQSYRRPMTGVHFLPTAVQAFNAGEWHGFIELAASLEPLMVVIDTQARITVGLEENSAKDMGLFVQRLDDLRVATGACILTIHHTGRGGEHMRGSISLDGAATTIIKVTKDEEGVTVTCDKQKDAEEFDDFALRMVPTGDSIVLARSDGRTPVMINATDKIWLRAWWDARRDDPCSISALTEVTKCPRSTLWRKLMILVDAGTVQRTGAPSRPLYALVSEPF